MLGINKNGIFFLDADNGKVLTWKDKHARGGVEDAIIPFSQVIAVGSVKARCSLG
jgi:hypothetical protein